MTDLTEIKTFTEDQYEFISLMKDGDTYFIDGSELKQYNDYIGSEGSSNTKIEFEKALEYNKPHIEIYAGPPSQYLREAFGETAYYDLDPYSKGLFQRAREKDHGAVYYANELQHRERYEQLIGWLRGQGYELVFEQIDSIDN